MAKLSFNIQLFNSASDQWFNEAQQEALLKETKAGLNGVTVGTDNMASAISSLADNWHSPDAEKYGNPLATNLKKFIKDSREYVASITNWMATHGTAINTINGATVSFSGDEANGSITINDFSDNAAHRGLNDVNTATATKTNLTAAVGEIEAALLKVSSAANSNPDALPQGVVPSSLVPTVANANQKINSSFTDVKTSVSDFVEKLSNAISEASSKAASDASGN